MFGETEKSSGEWVDGVFAAMWAKFNDRTRKDVVWIVCDGPVDSLWIESLNTVLDDNRILTLANGDRIPMTDNCKLMFEVQNLNNASPATVSRIGIVYVSDTDLDWWPVVESRVARINDTQRQILISLFSKIVGVASDTDSGALFSFLQRQCKSVLQVTRVHLATSCLQLLEGEFF